MKKIFTLLAGVLLAMGAQAQIASYTLDINKIYEDAKNATGDCPNASLNSGTKYNINDATITQGVFTVVSKSNRTYRVDVILTDETTKELVPVEYNSNYTGSYRLEPNGASNSTGGRQMFLEAAGPGKLYIGAWGNKDRKLVVMAADNKTSYCNPANASSSDFVHAFTDEETKVKDTDGNPQIFEIDIPSAGIYCITQDNGIYFGYVRFDQTSEGGGEVVKDPTDPTTWNFTEELSSTDASNLAADATNWVYDEENGYWKNNAVLAAKGVYVALKANEVELDITKGLEFARNSGDGIEADRIRIKPGKYLIINGSNTTIKLGELAKDDVVRLRIKGTGESERSLTVTNAEVTDGSLTTADADEHDVALKVTKNGNVTVTTGNGFQFLAITINADLPVVDGISTIKAETTTDAPVYNLQGQRVDASYRGVVIQNGKKAIQK